MNGWNTRLSALEGDLPGRQFRVRQTSPSTCWWSC